MHRRMKNGLEGARGIRTLLTLDCTLKQGTLSNWVNCSTAKWCVLGIHVSVNMRDIPPGDSILSCTKGLSTCEGRRGHATPHKPVETDACGY